MGQSDVYNERWFYLIGVIHAMSMSEVVESKGTGGSGVSGILRAKFVEKVLVLLGQEYTPLQVNACQNTSIHVDTRRNTGC